MKELVKGYKNLANVSKDLVGSVTELTEILKQEKDCNQALNLMCNILAKSYITALQDLEDLYAAVSRMENDAIKIPRDGLCSVCGKDPANFGTCDHSKCTLFEWRDPPEKPRTQFVPRCSFPAGVEIKLGSLQPIEPCVYEQSLLYTNVNVQVGKCRNCGRTTANILQTRDSKVLRSSSNSRIKMSLGIDSEQGMALDFLFESMFNHLKSEILKALNGPQNEASEFFEQLTNFIINGSGEPPKGFPIDNPEDKKDPQK